VARARLPFSFARDNQVALDADQLLVGPAATVNGLREARRRAGTALKITRLDEDAFQAAFALVYNADEPAENEAAVVFDLEDDEASGKVRDILKDPSDAPVVRLVNGLLRQAVRAHASDLHLEPYEDGLRVRMRVDGTMRALLNRRDVPARRLVSRIKVMAGLDIAETRLPQDGRIALILGGRSIDVRLSTLPGHHGERVVMRLLDRTAGLMALDRLGLSEKEAQHLRRLAAMPNGIILASGPTGSGKTTTLYSLLKLANWQERTILTVEDPVEYDLPGISQMQINPDIDLTFARGLRSLLRQDPDVILVGEIRDGETAAVACEAALTGHLVFSSIHANSALAAFTRLADLGIEGYLTAATLRAVIAQRLLRHVCPHCATNEPTQPREKALFESHGIVAPVDLRHAQGCETCGGSGYLGRFGVFDILEITDAIRASINADTSDSHLREVVGPRPTLTTMVLDHVARGDTTLEEMHRVMGEDM